MKSGSSNVSNDEFKRLLSEVMEKDRAFLEKIGRL